jgi:hypothetical protein
MSRLSTHLPHLASLALAVIAAAVSHSVHVDRSTGSPAGESRSQAAGPTAAPRKPRRGAASTRSKARHRGHRAARSGERHEPPARPVVVVTVSAQRPRAQPPRHVDRLHAGRGVTRGVDPAFEHRIVDGRTAAPAPPVPTATDGVATSQASALDGGTGGVAAPATTTPNAD